MLTVTIHAETAEELHAKVLGLIGARKPMMYTPEVKPTDVQPTRLMEENAAAKADVQPTSAPGQPITEQPATEISTAEVVPIAERKKPGRPKKTETVVDAEPAKPTEPAVTVEDARAVLKDVQTKIGSEEARQLNKKHGPEPLSEKKPAQWAAIIADGKALLAALEE